MDERHMEWGAQGLSAFWGGVRISPGQCQLCGRNGLVLEADPEQAGHGRPMCRACIDGLFDRVVKAQQEAQGK